MAERKYLRVLGKRNVSLVKGLKIVHIGQDVWKVGKTSSVKNPDPSKYGNAEKINHCVIYGPNKKEFHVYGFENIDFLNRPIVSKLKEYDNYGDYDRSTSYVNKHGNKVVESNLKIYILTHILDNKENWCFDLTNIPQSGKLKVIYQNGTVKNIDFTGAFEPITYRRKTYTKHTIDSNKEITTSLVNSNKFSWERTTHPFGYRIK